MPPTVSITLPVYNGERLVEDTIHTILVQDYRDFELVIVDDGSTDNTVEIIKRIVDPRIRIISLQQNQGIGFARNRAIREATGEIIALADADDHWKEGKLSKQVATLLQYPEIDLLFSDFQNINQAAGTAVSGLSETQAGLNVLKIQALSDTLFMVLDNAVEGLLIANFVATPTMIFRRDLIDRVGNLHPDLREAPDYEFVLRCAVLGARLAFDTEILIVRYKTTTSVTAHPDRFNAHALDALDQFEALCTQYHRSDVIPAINQKRYRLWQSQILLQSRMGNRKLAWQAFKKHSAYGRPSRRSVFYLGLALVGARGIEVGKQIKHGLSGKKSQ